MVTRNIVRNEPLHTNVSFREKILSLANITDSRLAMLLDESLDTLRRNLQATKTITVAGVPMEIENSSVQVQSAKVLMEFVKASALDSEGSAALSRSIKIVVNTAESGTPIFDVTPEEVSAANGRTPEN